MDCGSGQKRLHNTSLIFLKGLGENCILKLVGRTTDAANTEVNRLIFISVFLV